MAASILLTGATGRLGRLICDRLLAAGHELRLFSRHPEQADALWPGRVHSIHGDFADRSSLDAALKGIERLLLLSPLTEQLVEHQEAVIDAAARAGVQRIVKISGSDWTIVHQARSRAGRAHQAVENRLARSGIDHVSLRPNAWMQVALAPHLLAARHGGPLVSAYPAAVSFIDARDIADIAADALTSATTPNGPLILTGGQALTVKEIAQLAGDLLKRKINVRERPYEVAGNPSFEQAAVGEFMTLIAEGQAAAITPTLARLLGRPPRNVAAYLRDHLTPAQC